MKISSMQRQIEDATSQYHHSVMKSKRKAFWFTVAFIVMLIAYFLPWERLLR